jgi:hypothetical protein
MEGTASRYGVYAAMNILNKQMRPDDKVDPPSSELGVGP